MSGVQLTTQGLTSEQNPSRFQFPIDSVIEPNGFIVIANNALTYDTDDYSWLILGYNLFEWQGQWSEGDNFSKNF